MSIPTPEFPFGEERRYFVSKSNYSTGSVRRKLHHPNKVRRFSLVWKTATIAEKDTLLAEVNTAKGKAGTLSYTPIDEVSAVTVRFVSDTFKWTWVAPNQVAMSIVFEEDLF